MAIIIPSKNIYSMNNPKVRDNVVDKIEIKQSVASEYREYDVAVYSDKPNYENFSKGEKKESSKYAEFTASPEHRYTETINSASGIPLKLENIIARIPKFKNNILIEEILSGLDKDNNPQIKYTVQYEVYRAEITAKATVSTVANNIYSISIYDITPFDNRQYTKTEKGTRTDIKGTLSISSEQGLSGSHTSITLEDETNLGNVDIHYDEESDKYYTTTYTIQVGSILDSLSYNASYVPGMEIPTEKSLSGYSIYNKPVSVELTFYGTKVTLNITDGSVTYGSGNKPHSLSGNELLQDSGKVHEVALTVHLANNVLSQYQNGKETAEIVCQIGNYSAAIGYDAERMTFSNGDIVVPMIRNPQGVDIPMSRNADGSAKEFEVCGVNVYYDGAVWQKLYLKEIGVQNG